MPLTRFRGEWMDGGFLPPEQLWEDAQVGFEQRERRIYFWADDPAGTGRVGVGREGWEMLGRRRFASAGGGSRRARRTRSVQGCEREGTKPFSVHGAETGGC